MSHENENAQPWERQAEEPPKHYEWFHTYLMLGPGRSLLGAYNAFHAQSPQKSSKVHMAATHVSPSWKMAFDKQNWVERARAWDTDQRRLKGLKWDERKEVLQERMWTLSERLLDRVDKMLAFPLQRTTSSKDGKTITIEPAGWSLHTVARLIREANAIGKSACKIEQQRISDEVDEMDDEEALTAVIRELEVLGYKVEFRGTQDNDDDDEEPAGDETTVVNRAKQALQTRGYLVVPPAGGADSQATFKS